MGAIALLQLLLHLAAGPRFLAQRAGERSEDSNVWVYLPFIVSPERDMVTIPHGAFQMGCDDANPQESCAEDERPLHTVYLDSYRIDVREVTNAEYQACMDAGACGSPSSGVLLASEGDGTDSPYADHPVVYISWENARDYCGWVDKRLPTEAEWERAARGDEDTRVYPWGDQDPDCGRLNYNGHCVRGTTPVGTHPSGASPCGALDMAGNVMEWVSDGYQSDYYTTSPAANPAGPTSAEFKVLRGGAWDSGPEYVRVADRHQDYPNVGRHNVGFRCADDAVEP